MGYFFIIAFGLVLIPVIFLLSTRRAGSSGTQGEKSIGKPVMVEEPAADEPTPAASSLNSNTEKAQSRTPPA